MSRAPSLRAGSGVEVAPLSHRVSAMAAFRLVQACLVTGIGIAYPDLPGVPIRLTVVYLVVTGLLSLAVLTPARSLAVKGFGISLLVDGTFLQYAHEQLGHRPAIDALIVAQLAAVCLLASFRTGLKLAVWQSVLMVFYWRAEESGLLPAAAPLGGDRQLTIGIDMALLWLTVLTTSVTASINERELRRRRYDAEALERFASTLLADESPSSVARRLTSFAVAELGVPRAAVVTRSLGHNGSIRALAGIGVSWEGSGASASALLDLVQGNAGTVQALGLDPRRDPALAAMLPEGRRIAAVPMQSGGSLSGDGRANQCVALILEFGPGSGLRGGRAERRTLSTAAQAAATATIALSRAQLLTDARRAAATDGLTGLANRRAFDERMIAAERSWRENGIPYALTLVDVDRFKGVNDQFGHQVGDGVLIAVARALDAQAGPGATVARYGGEEFALIIPGADATAAATIAERARHAVRAITDPVPVSASFGVAAVPEDAPGINEVILAADAALLHAKGSGRDRVVIYEPAVAAAQFSAG